MDIDRVEILYQFRKNRGLIGIKSKIPVRDEYMLSLLYTPGVAEPCRKINQDVSKALDYTTKGNAVALLSDGSDAVVRKFGTYGLIPLLESHAVLCRELAAVDMYPFSLESQSIESIPICLATQDPDVIVRVVSSLTPILGGINLEDISAPRCFDIEEKLRQATDIPIFHDDQHGTATVVLAGMLKAARHLNTKLSEISIVMNGAGASAIAVTQLLLKMGVEEVILCDTQGPLYEGRQQGMNFMKKQIAKITNRQKKKGTLRDVIKGAKLFVGLSGPGTMDREMVLSMQKDPIIFALANPTPESRSERAKRTNGQTTFFGCSVAPV